MIPCRVDAAHSPGVVPADNEGGCETCHGDSALYRASRPLVVSALLASDAEILPGAETDHPYIWDLPKLLTALGVFTEVCISSPCRVTGCGSLSPAGPQRC